MIAVRLGAAIGNGRNVSMVTLPLVGANSNRCNDATDDRVAAAGNHVVQS